MDHVETIILLSLYTYGIGIGIGSGSKIFLPPFRSNAVRAAFLSIFFFPASTWLGVRRAASTTATTKRVDKILKYLILM